MEQKERAAAGGARREGGAVLSVAATFRYCINAEEGVVAGATCTWGGVRGGVAEPRDAYDIYVRQTGILTWEEEEAAGEEAGEEEA